MYLIDTNIWLERLLNQTKSEEVGHFLASVSSDQLAITDFAFHSLGVILLRLNHPQHLLSFVDDVFIQGDVRRLELGPEDMPRLIEASKEWKLDFDDAYQYVAAEKYHLVLVSFDSDFDRTNRKRKTPADLLSSLTNNKNSEKTQL